MQIFGRVCIGLLVFELTIIGIFSLKLAIWQSTLMLPLLFATGVFYRYADQTYHRSSVVLPLDVASKIDSVRKTDRSAAEIKDEHSHLEEGFDLLGQAPFAEPGWGVDIRQKPAFLASSRSPYSQSHILVDLVE